MKIEGLNMKKLALALVATAAFAGQAMAADMPMKAARPVAAPLPVASWTGCYVGGGGGYGMYTQDNTQFDLGPPRTQLQATHTNGGRGWLATVQGGCDYQFGLGSQQFVIGAYGDYDWTDIKGEFAAQNGNYTGTEKMSSAWSVGGRVGWLAFPGLLTYFSAGYTEATFDRTNLSFFPAIAGNVNVLYFDKQTYKGWYLGAGDEYALNFLPGLFWKTEYRFSRFDASSFDIRTTATNALNGDSFDTKKYTHTIRSSLVYRFNWGGPVVAKY
jgi:outer membrane immunogenic protein